MAVEAPSGLPIQWFPHSQTGARVWGILKAKLTGKKNEFGDFFSEVNLSNADADKVIENIKKDPNGYPHLDDMTGKYDEKYQKWLVETYLGGKPSGEPAPPPTSSAIVPTDPKKKKEDLVEEQIDPKILSLLGLKDVFDFTYEEYQSLLKEASIKGRMSGGGMPTESIELLTNEFKRVKNKTGPFKGKAKPKTVDTDAFFGRKKSEEVFKPKALLPSADKLGDVAEEPGQEKRSDILDFLKGDFLKELQSIRQVVEDIAENLQKQYDLDKQERESSRRSSELGRGRRRERDLESKEDKAPTLLQKITKPFTSLFDTIKNFLLNVLLGSAVVWLLDLFKNPQKLLQPVQGVLNGIFGFFNNIIQWIDKTVVDPIRGFITNVNNTIQAFINQVNNALKLIPGGGQIQAPQLPNIPKAPTLTAPNITGMPVKKAKGGGEMTVSHSNGYITKDTGVEVSGLGPDTQLTALKPREFVLVPGAAQELGIDFLKGLNRKYGGTNNPQTANIGSSNISAMSGGGLVGENKMSPADYHSLLAISSLEDDDPQGRADVAQSIYNRVLAGQKYDVNFYQKKNTIKDHILAQGQFQPTFTNPMDWKNIKDKKTAAIAVMNSAKGKKHKWNLSNAMKELDNTEKALKNPSLQRSAQKMVGGRAFFLSAPSDYQQRPGETWRGQGSNFFFPSSLEGTKYDQERRNVAAPVPPMLQAKSKPTIPGKRSRKSPSIIPFPFGQKKGTPGGSRGAKSTPKVSFPSTDPNNITTVITSAILGLIN